MENRRGTAYEFNDRRSGTIHPDDLVGELRHLVFQIEAPGDGEPVKLPSVIDVLRSSLDEIQRLRRELRTTRTRLNEVQVSFQRYRCHGATVHHRSEHG